MQGDEEPPVSASRIEELETELRRARARQRQVERRLEELTGLINRSSTVVIRWRVEPYVWPVDFVSENVRQFGYEPEEFTSGGMTWASVAHPDDVERLESQVREEVGQRNPAFTQHYRLITKTGEIRFVEDHTIAVFNDDGSVSHYEGIVQDITERRRDEERLRDSEAKFAAFFEAAPIPFAIVVEGGHYLEVNSAFERSLGFCRDEVRGRMAQELNIFPDREVFERGGRILLETGSLSDHEMPFRRKDGEIRTGIFSARKCIWGEHLAFLTALVDITERKEAEAALQRSYEKVEERVVERTAVVQLLLESVERRAAEMDATIGSIADAVLIATPQQRIVRTNAAARELFGHPQDRLEVPLEEWLRLVRPQTAEGEEIALEGTATYRAVVLGQTTRGSMVHFIRPDGQPRWVSVSAAPITSPDGTLLGGVTTFMDVTRLHDLQQRQEDLLHIVSHDLRVPLSVIQGHMELLEEGLEEHHIDGRLSLNTSTINRNVRRLDRMIQDLVDKALLEGRRLELKISAVRLHEYLADLLQRLRDILPVHRVVLDVPEDLPAASSDEARLERIVLNLLSNALKYSPPESLVEIRASSNDREVVVTVRDHGGGIEPQQLDRLFQRFYRAGEQKSGGIGLGLYTTKMLVEAHHGRLWVESEVGKGSSFCFSLPIFAGG